MAEQEKQDINIPIEAKIKATNGLVLGDNKFNSQEEELLRKIAEEHGTMLASAKEEIGIEFGKLIEDVSGYSERDQKMLPEVAKMLGVKVENINDAWQMNYALFQAILKFQKEHNMKLTGMVDEEGILYQAIKKHSEEKKTTPPEGPENTDNTTQPAPETEQIPPPAIPSSIPRATPINSEQENTVQQHEGQDERSSMPTPPNSPVPSAPETTAPTSPVQPTSTPSGTAETKPEVRALPVEEAAEKTAAVEQVITEEAKKLGITLDDITMIQSDFGQSIVDMILYYEGGDVGRTKDTIGYDIGGGLNDRSKELPYALGGETNYNAWIKTGIPSEELIRQSVERMLHARVALTRTSCRNEGVDFDTLPAGVKGVLVDIHYNMPNNIHEFRKFWKALQEKNWQEAGKQLIDSGRGGPSSYLNQVKGRAYANAMILADGEDGNINLHRQYKEEGGSNSSNLYQKYNDTIVTRKEVKKMLEGINTVDELIQNTTSAKLLSSERKFGDKGSTRAVIEMIKGFKKKYPGDEERITERMKEILQEKIGNYSRTLQTPEEIGAFQQLVYLTDPQVFKNLEFIDGIKGPKTTGVFNAMRQKELQGNT